MKIKKIEEIKPRVVYAISTSTKTFIADGLAHHNCVGCNVFKKGNYPVYSDRLIKEKGSRIIGTLNKRGGKTIKVDEKFYEDVIKKYQKKINKL